MLRMFEQWVGQETFRRGIQRYLQTHADGNATARDFLRAISESAGRDVAPAFDTFLDRPGVPRIQATVRCGGTGAVLQLAQDRWLPAGSTGDRSGVWQIPVCTRWSTQGQGAEPLHPARRAHRRAEARGARLPGLGAPQRRVRRLLPSPARPDVAGTAGPGGDAERCGVGRAARRHRRAGAPAGHFPRSEGLQLAARKAGAKDHRVLEAAIKLATVREDFLAGRLGPAYAAWVRRVFGPHARALGMRRTPAEDDEAQLARPKATEFVAERGRGPPARRRGPDAWPRPGCRSPARSPRRWCPRCSRPPVASVDTTCTRRSSSGWTAPRTSASGAGSSTASPAPASPQLLDDNVSLATSGRLNPQGDRQAAHRRKVAGRRGVSAGLGGGPRPDARRHRPLLGHPGGAHASRRADPVLRRRRSLVQRGRAGGGGAGVRPAR